jgi:hypothetical protein
LPFSPRAKEWEGQAFKLRGMVSNGRNRIPFDPFELAPKVGLHVIPCEFQGLNDQERQQLETIARTQWSGGVFPAALPDGSRICMLNPLQSVRRSRITLMEEICHCHLEHEPTAMVINEIGLLVRDFNSRQEQEAFGVGAAVLIPWEVFFHKINAGAQIDELVELFDVTPHLVQYRIKVTGASRLFQSRQRSKALDRAARRKSESE